MNTRQINLLFLTGVIVISATFAIVVYAEEYEFVKCPNDSNIYPEGTRCDIISQDFDDDSDSEEATEDEEEAMEEAEDD